MEEKKEQKKKKFLLVLIPILAAALVAGGVFAVTQIGKNKPEPTPTETETETETEVETETEDPYADVDDTIWVNIDKKYFYQMTEGNLSGREAEADGLYHVLMAKDGEVTEFLVDKFKVVNNVDNWDFICLNFSEDGKYITGVTKLEDAGYNILVENMYVAEVFGDSITYDVFENLDGLQAPYTPDGEVKVIDCAQQGKVVGDSLGVMEVGRQFTVLQKNGVDYVYMLEGEGIIYERVYWNVERQFDSEILATKRVKNADGFYEIQLSCNGEMKTYLTKSRDIATNIDAYAARCCSLKLNKKGEICKFISIYQATNGSCIGSWHTVVSVAEDGSSFHVKKL